MRRSSPYVYDRYGRHHAAQVANVITYRARSAVRDLGKALGHSPEQVDGWAKGVDNGEPLDRGGPLPPAVAALAGQVLDFPRHLGIHSGGMVICDRPVVEVCPVEWARHPGRTVLQWDKDDCAEVGLVKFDLLGLGMLDALHRAVDLVGDAHGVEIDLAMVPQEDAVYDMLCRADTVGVFQVESRAQMATLPRLRPRCFYDLVIEVALIRPGPIQGGSVHPYIRRRQGPRSRHLPAPAAREGPGQDARGAAVPGAAHADGHRRRRVQRRPRPTSCARPWAPSAREPGWTRLRERLYAGMAERGITGEVADEILGKLAAFANFGFPESHSVSFAYLVYSSAWFKLHYPAAFCAALLNAQPMGFWSPQSLVADARRHGIVVHRPHVDRSGAEATLDWGVAGPAGGPVGSPGRQPDVRLGIGSVRSIGAEAAECVSRHRPYASMEDLVRRGGVSRSQLEALATAGALEGLPPGTGPPSPATGGGAAGARRCGPPGWWPWPPPTACRAS